MENSSPFILSVNFRWNPQNFAEWLNKKEVNEDDLLKIGYCNNLIASISTVEPNLIPMIDVPSKI